MTTPATDLWAASIRDAAAGLEGVAVRSRLLPLTLPGGREFLLKCEQEQPVGAFKIRGAWTALSRLPADLRQAGVITHSSGNHAQAIAWSARRLGIPAVIVMPQDAPRIKVDGVRRQGADIIFVAHRSERDPRCRAVAAERGLTIIPPYEHADVIAGQGTVALEMLAQRPDLRTILVPVGGGGLLAGTAAWLASSAPDVQVIGVEPAGAPKLSAALSAGHPVAVPDPHSIADGLLPPALGDLPFSVIGGTVKDAVQVNDESIIDAVRWLYQEHGLTVEPSGAITTAALLAGLINAPSPMAAVASGGNIDPDTLRNLVN